jgi:hypothetical protein
LIKKSQLGQLNSKERETLLRRMLNLNSLTALEAYFLIDFSIITLALLEIEKKIIYLKQK